VTCGCQAIILVAKVFHFDHFSGTFASAGRPIIFVSKTKMADHFTGKPEKKTRAIIPADHLWSII